MFLSESSHSQESCSKFLYIAFRNWDAGFWRSLFRSLLFPILFMFIIESPVVTSDALPLFKLFAA